MSKIRITEIKYREFKDIVRVSSSIKIDDNKHKLWYRMPKEFFNFEQAQSAFFLSMFPACLSIGGELTIDGVVSPKLLSNIPTIENILKSWFPRRFKNELKINSKELMINNSPSKKKVGCFFTAGIDSMSTFLQHKDEIDYLIYVHRFIEPKEIEYKRKQKVENIKKVAKLYGKEVIEIMSNVAIFSHDYVNWTSQSHGAIFASMAIMLSQKIGKFYFASSNPYETLVPYASHPALDYLFEVEDMRFIHDGAEFKRIQKCRNIGKYPETLKHVDFGCTGKQCRKAYKCIRSLLNLDLAGVWKQATLCRGHGYTAKEFEEAIIPSETDYFKALENYKELANHPDKEDIRRAIRISIDRYKKKRRDARLEWKLTDNKLIHNKWKK